MSIIENVPKPVLWGGAAVVVLWMFLRPGREKESSDGTLDATMASMNLSAASNIQALGLTSQRDVALAGEYTNRYAIANQTMVAREGMALEFMKHRAEGQNHISALRTEHVTIRTRDKQQYKLAQQEERRFKQESWRAFRVARGEQRLEGRRMWMDFRLERVEQYMYNKHFPQRFQLELEYLKQEADKQRQMWALAMRRLDIQMQSMMGGMMYGPGGMPGAVGQYVDAAGNIVNMGLGIYDRYAGSQGGYTAGGALSGAATGAAMGAAGGPIGMAAGAAAGAASSGS